MNPLLRKYISRNVLINNGDTLGPYMQKAGDCGDISPQIFLDFPQNFGLRTRNQYCTQAIAWGSTILDGGSTILDGSSTIFCRFSPFFVDFHHFYRFSRFTHVCRDLHFVAIYALFPQFFLGQNSLLCNITRFLHVCLAGSTTPPPFEQWNKKFRKGDTLGLVKLSKFSVLDSITESTGS